MMHEDILKLAREAGLGCSEGWGGMRDFLFEFTNLVASAEREECARAYETEAETWKAWPQAGAAKRRGAAAIRARGTKEI